MEWYRTLAEFITKESDNQMGVLRDLGEV